VALPAPLAGTISNDSKEAPCARSSSHRRSSGQVVNVLGIDSGGVREPVRSRIWERLAGDLRPRGLPEMTRPIAFDDLPGVFDAYSKGKARGRFVAAVAAD